MEFDNIQITWSSDGFCQGANCWLL